MLVLALDCNPEVRDLRDLSLKRGADLNVDSSISHLYGDSVKSDFPNHK